MKKNRYKAVNLLICVYIIFTMMHMRTSFLEIGARGAQLLLHSMIVYMILLCMYTYIYIYILLVSVIFCLYTIFLLPKFGDISVAFKCISHFGHFTMFIILCLGGWLPVHTCPICLVKYPIYPQTYSFLGCESGTLTHHFLLKDILGSCFREGPNLWPFTNTQHGHSQLWIGLVKTHATGGKSTRNPR
jgi:hypothetical protein